MSVQPNRVYRFAGCELDVHERRLLAHGQPVSLTPKVFDTLALLVERAGHAVSKDELMSALWPRGFVHESNLTKHIWLIRRALGDDGGESRFIETVSKLGYRFIAPVDSSVAPAPSDVESASREASAVASTASPNHRGMSRRGWATAGLIAVAVVIVALAAYRNLLPHVAKHRARGHA